VDDLVRLTGPRATATNRTATQADVASHFQQNRQFWTSDPVTFNGNRVFQRNDLIDPNKVDSATGLTNKQLMEQGYAPYGPDGNKINLHHMTQTQNGAIAEMTQTFHQQNSGTIHINTGNLPSGINRSQFDRWRKQYWSNRANDF
jgi:filamentous hemagglutinin